MTDLLILVALVVLNGVVQAAWFRWRARRAKPRGRKQEAVPQSQPAVGPSYPMHPSPIGMDW